jgi:hypothetical protein
VQLGAVDAKCRHHVQHDAGEQGGSVRVKEPAQHASEAVVVQRTNLVLAQTEQRRVIGGGPLADGVDGAVTHGQVAHEDAQSLGRGEAQPGVVLRHGPVQRGVEVEPGELPMVHDRHRSEQGGLELDVIEVWTSA